MIAQDILNSKNNYVASYESPELIEMNEIQGYDPEKPEKNDLTSLTHFFLKMREQLFATFLKIYKDGKVGFSNELLRLLTCLKIVENYPKYSVEKPKDFLDSKFPKNKKVKVEEILEFVSK